MKQILLELKALWDWFWKAQSAGDIDQATTIAQQIQSKQGELDAYCPSEPTQTSAQ